jgi:YVTN family beta-propeller protein
MRQRLILVFLALVGTQSVIAQGADYNVFVSNERSGDVTLIDGATDNVLAKIPVGKRPRGIHASADGRRVYVTLSGSLAARGLIRVTRSAPDSIRHSQPMDR